MYLMVGRIMLVPYGDLTVLYVWGLGSDEDSSCDVASGPAVGGFEGSWPGCVVLTGVVWADSVDAACLRCRWLKMACCSWAETPAFLVSSLNAWICCLSRASCCWLNWLDWPGAGEGPAVTEEFWLGAAVVP